MDVTQAALPHDTILHGDALSMLRTLPSESVQCCVTSPPYWSLRDYGVPGQLGLEATPDEYMARMVEVFREVRRVLRNDGTCWVNLGDSYGGDRGNMTPAPDNKHRAVGAAQIGKRGGFDWRKQLLGMPWRLAFALQADGWYLRADIIWAKPNPMPESVTDRPTKSHEYIFLLSKRASYYYDSGAIREDPAPQSLARIHQPNFANQTGGPKDYRTTGVNPNRSMRQTLENFAVNPGRNKRSVWTVATAPFAQAHFATFPPKLIEPCILAGAPAGGLVLDPFMGAGTVGVVCRRHSRHYLGIELNAAYIAMAQERIANEVQPALWTAQEAG